MQGRARGGTEFLIGGECSVEVQLDLSGGWMGRRVTLLAQLQCEELDLVKKICSRDGVRWQLGNRATNQTVAGSIPGRDK